MDISGLLEKLGIRTETITSGDNKAMGSSVEAMTYEQKQIFQSLIDEAYDQFVEIVAEGRNMEDAKVRINQEKELAMKELRNEVAKMSIAIAEKVVRKDLSSDSSQKELVDKLVDEVSGEIFLKMYHYLT